MCEITISAGEIGAAVPHYVDDVVAGYNVIVGQDRAYVTRMAIKRLALGLSRADRADLIRALSDLS